MQVAPNLLPLNARVPVTVDARGRRVWRAGTLTYTTAGLTVLFAWLLWGDFAWMLKERSVVPVAQLLLKKFEASDLLVGILVGSLPAALGFIIGPIVSMRSDRHRGRWGRRIPFLLIPTPIAALGIFGLAFTPRLGAWLHASLGESSPGFNASVLIVFSLCWTVFEIATIVANAVLGGLINDVVPQEIIGRFFGYFRAVSLSVGVIFFYFFMGHAEEYYFWIFCVVGLIYGVGFTLMCLNVKEGEYPPPPALARVRDLQRATLEELEQIERKLPDFLRRFFAIPAGAIRLAHRAWPDALRAPFRPFARATLSLLIYTRECYTNPYYLWIFCATTLATMAFTPIGTFTVFYAKSVGMNMDTLGKYTALSYTISLGLAFVLGSLADRFHPLRVGIVTIGAFALLAAWAGFYATTVATFTFAYVAQTVLTGSYVTATASIGQRLYPKNSFAQFASAAGLINGLFCAILPPLVGKSLDMSGHIYRYTFIYGAAFATLSLIGYIMVYRRFLRLGGPQGYVAPA